MYYPKTHIEDLKLTRPKASKLLPNVLSQNEVIRFVERYPKLKA
ncbi:hypothetical protein [Algibacter sp. 2305UL17-15]